MQFITTVYTTQFEMLFLSFCKYWSKYVELVVHQLIRQLCVLI